MVIKWISENLSPATPRPASIRSRVPSATKKEAQNSVSVAQYVYPHPASQSCPPLLGKTLQNPRSRFLLHQRHQKLEIRQFLQQKRRPLRKMDPQSSRTRQLRNNRTSGQEPEVLEQQIFKRKIPKIFNERRSALKLTNSQQKGRPWSCRMYYLPNLDNYEPKNFDIIDKFMQNKGKSFGKVGRPELGNRSGYPGPGTYKHTS